MTQVVTSYLDFTLIFCMQSILIIFLLIFFLPALNVDLLYEMRKLILVSWRCVVLCICEQWTGHMLPNMRSKFECIQQIVGKKMNENNKIAKWKSAWREKIKQKKGVKWKIFFFVVVGVSVSLSPLFNFPSEYTHYTYVGFTFCPFQCEIVWDCLLAVDDDPLFPLEKTAHLPMTDSKVYAWHWTLNLNIFFSFDFIGERA